MDFPRHIHKDTDGSINCKICLPLEIQRIRDIQEFLQNEIKYMKSKNISPTDESVEYLEEELDETKKRIVSLLKSKL